MCHIPIVYFIKKAVKSCKGPPVFIPGKYTEKTESQIDLLLRVLLVLGSEGLYLCTEKEGLLALALVTYLRAYISIKRHICDVGSLNYDDIMTPSGCLLVCVSLSIFIT